jgi:hypothetical protein
VCLAAEAREGVPAPEQDVVRVDAVELRARRLAGERGLRVELDVRLSRAQVGPVGGGDVEGPVDVDPRDPERAQVVDVRLDGFDGTSLVGLQVNRNREPRRVCLLHDQREPDVLG